jgi:hypothetical protein
MKLELKENMYVRNCYGRIAKIEYIEDNIAYCDNWLYQCYEDFITFIDLNEKENINKITKSSYNIIDILEVGDYVNGYIAEEIKRGYDGKIWIDNGTRGYDEGGEYIIWKRNEDIKSIVTKERFKNMEYRIGE